MMTCTFSFAAMAADASYRVGEEDTITIAVLGENDFSGSFRIGADGTIDYPYLRKIDVKNKTTEELSKLFTEKLKDGYLKDPQVNVSVKEFQSQKILVVGAISKPGKYALSGETKIIDAISMAGGIANQGAKKIILIRAEKLSDAVERLNPEALKTLAKVDPIVIDYYSLIHQGDFSQNLVLKNGDIINIPEANEVFVLGNVAKPGPVKFEEKMTVVQAVTQAGGPTPTASTRATYILRYGSEGQSKISVRLDKILENKEKNVPLLANDVIVIPESFF